MKAGLNLGCGQKSMDGWTNLDQVQIPGVDTVWDLRKFPWPFADGWFNTIYASHVLEHLPDLDRTMKEIARILRLGGVFRAVVPHYQGEDAFTDPTHVHFFTPHTLDYWCDTDLHRTQSHLYPILFESPVVTVRRLKTLGILTPRTPIEIDFWLTRR